jgi:hypothetical protein
MVNLSAEPVNDFILEARGFGSGFDLGFERLALGAVRAQYLKFFHDSFSYPVFRLHEQRYD